MKDHFPQTMNLSVTLHLPDLKRILRQSCEAGAGGSGDLAEIAQMIQRNFNLQESNMATTKERLAAIGSALDEVASDITELKAKVASGQVPAEDFEAELASIESKVTSAKDQYQADATGGGAVDENGNPV